GGSWTYTLDPNAGATTLIISEFLSDNETGIEDEDGTRSDWIEVYNPGPLDANLAGWFLTDTPATNSASITNLSKWRFPAVTLGANKYLLLWASYKNKTNPLAPLHANFKLSKADDPLKPGYLALVDPGTNVISAFSNYVAQVTDVSYGRDAVDPDIVVFFNTPPPGAQNPLTGGVFAAEPVFSRESGVYTNNTVVLSISAPAG